VDLSATPFLNLDSLFLLLVNITVVVTIDVTAYWAAPIVYDRIDIYTALTLQIIESNISFAFSIE
jgi:hypothetical protein